MRLGCSRLTLGIATLGLSAAVTGVAVTSAGATAAGATAAARPAAGSRPLRPYLPICHTQFERGFGGRLPGPISGPSATVCIEGNQLSGVQAVASARGLALYNATVTISYAKGATNSSWLHGRWTGSPPLATAYVHEQTNFYCGELTGSFTPSGPSLRLVRLCIPWPLGTLPPTNQFRSQSGR